MIFIQEKGEVNCVFCILVTKYWLGYDGLGRQDEWQGMCDELWWTNLFRERDTLNTEKGIGDKYDDGFW